MNKLMQRELPTWENDSKPACAQPAVVLCHLTEHTTIRVDDDVSNSVGCGVIVSRVSGYEPCWPEGGSMDAKKLVTLQRAFSEMETCLPIIRAMLQNINSQVKDDSNDNGYC